MGLVLINFDLMYKMLSNQGPGSEKRWSICLALSAVMKLLQAKIIFKYSVKQGSHYELGPALQPCNSEVGNTALQEQPQCQNHQLVLPAPVPRSV